MIQSGRPSNYSLRHAAAATAALSAKLIIARQRAVHAVEVGADQWVSEWAETRDIAVTSACNHRLPQPWRREYDAVHGCLASRASAEKNLVRWDVPSTSIHVSS